MGVILTIGVHVYVSSVIPRKIDLCFGRRRGELRERLVIILQQYLLL